MVHRSAFLASLVVSIGVAHAEPASPRWVSDRTHDGVVFARQVIPGAALAPTGRAQTRTIYLNHHGTRLSPGVNDSQLQTSTVVSRVSEIAGWDATPADWAATVACMKDIWSRFDVTVTDVDPGATPHIEALFGGSPTALDLPGTIGGISPFTTDCSVIEHSIVFAFTDNLSKKPRSICEVMSQEIAHSYGLDHELAADDPMTYLPFTGDREFQDRDVACGENTARPCGIPGSACRATQNSYQLLHARLGDANRDHQPPSVGITTPAQSATVAAGFAITATATDDVAVASVAFYLDGDLLATATVAPYRLATDPALAPGAHTIVVEATDSDGNSATQQRDITVAGAASTASDSMAVGCSSGGQPPLALLALVLVAVLARRRNQPTVA
jgi:MYXO-CTERM domain-containing protein